jgi:opacity protein-like surface antigen
MKLLFGAAAAAALLAGAGAASAQMVGGSTQIYGTLGYTQMNSELDDDVFTDKPEVNIGAITGRVGARFTPYLGAEGELSFGVNESEDRFTARELGVTVTGDLNVKLSNEVAVFGVGFLPVAPNTDLFARVGVGRLQTEVETRVTSGGFSIDEIGDRESNFFAIGAGAQYFFDGLNGIRGEYTRYSLEEDENEDDRAEFDSFSISYVRRF